MICHNHLVTAVVLSALLAGCASVTTADGERLRPGQQAFAAYVERVFRLQNDTASALAFALDGASFDSPAYVELEAAEATLLEACAGLNALASARQRGERAGGLEGLAAARAAPDCEAAALDAAELLQR